MIYKVFLCEIKKNKIKPAFVSLTWWYLTDLNTRSYKTSLIPIFFYMSSPVAHGTSGPMMSTQILVKSSIHLFSL